MKNKVAWLVFSLFIVSAMLLASCGSSGNSSTTSSGSSSTTSATTAPDASTLTVTYGSVTRTYSMADMQTFVAQMGYGGSRKNAASQLGKSGDGGVDGVINEDRLGLDRVYVQAKRYGKGNVVGRPDVQAFVGSLVGLGAQKGVFVTTSTFSPQAREFVQHLSQRVILLDGHNLADLMIEHGVGVRTSRAIEFKRLDEDFFSEDN